MFEKFTWMILAKEHEIHDKVKAYKNDVYRLKKSIEFKLKTVKDKDKKDDLQIMLKNLSVLTMSHAWAYLDEVKFVTKS